jgi:hypothetical protein
MKPNCYNCRFHLFLIDEEGFHDYCMLKKARVSEDFAECVHSCNTPINVEERQDGHA